jgi:hypothetical protein
MPKQDRVITTWETFGRTILDSTHGMERRVSNPLAHQTDFEQLSAQLDCTAPYDEWEERDQRDKR